MTKKLTILVQPGNIRFAKRYARKRKTSISSIVDELLQMLKEREKLPEHPLLQKTAGIIQSGTRDPWEDLFGPKKK